MDLHAAFIRSVCETPSDDAPRLIYADWLDEHDDPRGEFIRIQCELESGSCRPSCDHRSRPCSGCRWKARRSVLRRRQRELLLEHWRSWVPYLTPQKSYEVILSAAWTYSGTPAVEFLRGFPSRLVCETSAFTGLAADLFATAPITAVTLCDAEPWDYEDDGTTLYRWQEADDEFADHATRGGTTPAAMGGMPRAVMKCLKPHPELRRDDANVARIMRSLMWSYPTPQAADDAISAACVRRGRRMAGLILSRERNPEPPGTRRQPRHGTSR